jgi:hypothetical protein
MRGIYSFMNLGVAASTARPVDAILLWHDRYFTRQLRAIKILWFLFGF